MPSALLLLVGMRRLVVVFPLVVWWRGQWKTPKRRRGVLRLAVLAEQGIETDRSARFAPTDQDFGSRCVSPLRLSSAHQLTYECTTHTPARQTAGPCACAACGLHSNKHLGALPHSAQAGGGPSRVGGWICVSLTNSPPFSHKSTPHHAINTTTTGKFFLERPHRSLSAASAALRGPPATSHTIR